MRRRIVMDSGSAEAASVGLRAALAGRPLVSVERFTTAYRTGYTGPHPLEVMRPSLAVGCYPAWLPAKPPAVLAAETRTRVRSPATRRGWLDQVVADAKGMMADLPAPPVVAGWFATGQLRDLAAAGGSGGVVVAIDGALRARLENKADFDQLLRRAGVPAEARIPAVRIDGPLPSLRELRQMVGTETVVVQAGVTSGGRGTVIVTGEAGMAAAAVMPAPYRVAAFVDGWSSNTTVLAVPDGVGGVRVYVDRPSHKSIAVGELGVGAAKSAGNDWSRPWPQQAAAVLVETAVRVAEWAWFEYRMVGLFGLDAILTRDGAVVVNEINCRNQGTTEVSAVNQQLRGMPPFVLAHLTALLGGRADWLGDPDEFNHATVRRAITAGVGPLYAKVRYTGPGPARLPGQFLGPGVYRLDATGRLQWVRPGAHPAAADADAGELLIANTPGPDVVCHPGAEVATLEGLTCGPGRPFSGPTTAADQTLRFTRALHELFTPAPATPKEVTP